MGEVTLYLASWNRFLTRNLAITPDLVGSAHEFTFEDQGVTIKLPPADPLPAEPNKGELLTFDSWVETNGTKNPQEFWVHAVDVTVKIPAPISLPEDLLKRHANAYDVVPDDKQTQLNELAESYEFLAEKAFGYWIRVLRWKSDNSSIGRPEVQRHESGWGTYLIRESPDQAVWIWHDVFRSKERRVVTSEIWRAAESALQSNRTPPIYVELMFDAIEHIRLDDLQRAVVDLAVACESFLRVLVTDSLPPGTPDSIKEYIDDANVRPVLTKFVPELLNEEERRRLKKIESSLHKLFDTRNDIVHVGRTDLLTPANCQTYLESTSALLRLRTPKE